MLGIVLTHTDKVLCLGMVGFGLFCSGMSIEGWLETRARRRNGLHPWTGLPQDHAVKVIDRPLHDWEEEGWA